MQGFQKGQIPWNKGIVVDRAKFPTMGSFGKRTQEFRDKARINNFKIAGWNKGRLMPQVTAEKNGEWRGDAVGYRALHHWVVRKLGKAIYCQNSRLHKAGRYHWANISGEYKRELSDWRQLCPSCNLTDGIHVALRFRERGIVA